MDAMQLPTDQELQEFAADWLKENFLYAAPGPVATTMITFCKAVLLEFGNRPVEGDDPCADGFCPMPGKKQTSVKKEALVDIFDPL